MFYKNKYGTWKYTMKGGMMPNRERYMANRGWTNDWHNAYKNQIQNAKDEEDTYNNQMFEEYKNYKERFKNKRSGVIMKMRPELKQWVNENEYFIQQDYNNRMFEEWSKIQNKRKRSRQGVIIPMPSEISRWANNNEDYIKQFHNPDYYSF